MNDYFDHTRETLAEYEARTGVSLPRSSNIEYAAARYAPAAPAASRGFWDTVGDVLSFGWENPETVAAMNVSGFRNTIGRQVSAHAGAGGEMVGETIGRGAGAVVGGALYGGAQGLDLGFREGSTGQGNAALSGLPSWIIPAAAVAVVALVIK